MSLAVSPELLVRAEADALMPDDFIGCIQSSLPRAWAIVIETMRAALSDRTVVIFDDPKLVDDTTRGEILRLFASDAMRDALQAHVRKLFGDLEARIAFQNCHKVGVFPGTEQGMAAWRDFTSARGQLLGQRPELLHC